MILARRGVIGALRVYQRVLSPVLHTFGGGCRFHPTCSAFALIAVERDGVVRGLIRTLGRLLRCHPLHPGGFDPP